MNYLRKFVPVIFGATIFFMVLSGSTVFAEGIAGGSASGNLDDQIRPNTRLSIYVPSGFESWLTNDVGYFSRGYYKAAYLAVDGDGSWAGGCSYNTGSSSQAKSVALGYCNDDRQATGVSNPCLLYAENDRVAYYDLNFENATISENYDIYLPSIELDGDDYSANLKFVEYDQYGNMYWILTTLTTNYSPANNAEMSSNTLMISIDSIIYAGTYDLWMFLEYAYYYNGYYYWKLNNVGFN